MEQMKKSLSQRDIILLLLLALMAVGALYYILIFKPTTARIETLRSQQEQVQTEIDTLNTKLQLLTKMKNELPLLQETNKPVAAYDNLKPVMAALNNIMLPSQEFDITFSTEEDGESGSIIRRNVNIGFACSDYASAKRIIEDLDDVAYRCQISSAVIASEGGTGADRTGDLNADPVRALVTITFFEAT